MFYKHAYIPLINWCLTYHLRKRAEHLDEMTRVSSSLTKVLWACNNFKTLGRSCRPFEYHNARGISLHSCGQRMSNLHPKKVYRNLCFPNIRVLSKKIKNKKLSHYGEMKISCFCPCFIFGKNKISTTNWEFAFSVQ